MSITYFKSGDYLSQGQVHDDISSRLEYFGEATQQVGQNAVDELIALQEGAITCQQVSVIGSAIANALTGRTYTEGAPQGQTVVEWGFRDRDDAGVDTASSEERARRIASDRGWDLMSRSVTTSEWRPVR